jgi:beta-N-acetylhexosaminidase
VLDLDHGASSVIGDRAFHRDPRVVALLAKSLMHGLLRPAWPTAASTFPATAFVKADSHTAMPVDRRSAEGHPGRRRAPYEWLSTTLASVMPAHVVYPKVDAGRRASRARWLQRTSCAASWVSRARSSATT